MILIHFDPGARGDFLANVLKNKFLVRDHGAFYTPLGVEKIHHVDDPTLLPVADVKIKIFLPTNSDDLIQIAHNHIIKNSEKLNFVRNPNLTFWEEYYYFVRFAFEKNNFYSKYKNVYDYCIEYHQLYDITFLEDLYFKINQVPLFKSARQKILENIEFQNTLRWQNDVEKVTNLTLVSELINFEIKNNLFNKKIECKFSLTAYLNDETPYDLLNHNNYVSENISV
jgi:hypothetical protein